MNWHFKKRILAIPNTPLKPLSKLWQECLAAWIRLGLLAAFLLSSILPGVSFAAYSIDKPSTTVGKNSWDTPDLKLPGLKLDAQLNGTILSLTASKMDGSSFTNSGTMKFKVGSPETFGVNREPTKTVSKGDYSSSHTHDLDDFLDIIADGQTTDYPKQFYARFEGADNITWAWVGPIVVSHQEDPPASLPAPTGLTATTITSVRIDTSWNTVSNATKYSLWRSTSSSSDSMEITCGLETSFYDRLLTQDTAYYYKVRAGNSQATCPNGTTGWSAFSETVSAKTLSQNPSDMTPPTITISSPAVEYVETTEASINIVGTASDDVGVTRVEWGNNNSGGNGLATGTSNWSVQIPLQEGTNVIVMTAYDAVMNSNLARVTVKKTTVTPPSDTQSPTINITGPTSATTYQTSEASLSLGGNAADDVGVVRVEWVNDRGGNGQASGTTVWSISGVVLQEGQNVITVTAYDATGKTGTDSLTVTKSSPLPSNQEPIFLGGSVTPNPVAQGASINFATIWKDPDSKYIVDVVVRYIQNSIVSGPVWQEEVLDFIGGEVNTGVGFSKTIPVPEGFGLFYYEFRASDTDILEGPRQHTTAWQGNDSFNVISPRSVNHAPKLQLVSAPTVAWPGKEYVIQLKAVDQDANLREIQVDWTGRGGQDGQVESQLAASGEVVTFKHIYPTKGSVTWTSTAYDASAGNSNMIRLWIPIGWIPKPVQRSQQLRNIRGQVSCGGKVGDPIDSATGSQELSHQLLTVQGVLPLSFTIHYNSSLLTEGVLGRGWRHDNFEASVQELLNGDVEVHWSANQSNLFTKNADGTFSPSQVACQFDNLVKNADGSFALTRKNQRLYEFDSAGQLVAIHNRQGQSLTFVRDASQRLTKVIEPVSGAFLSYAYNAEGLLETVSDSLGRQVHLGYDDQRNLTTITDATGQTTTYSYNEYGQTLTGINAEGVQFFTNTYDEEYRIISQQDGVANHQPYRLSYDESQPGKIITTVVNRDGNSRVYTYDDHFVLLSVQDELGNITYYTYDVNRHPINITDAKNHTTQLGYDTHGNLATLVDAAGNTTKLTYDDQNNLVFVENAEGKLTRFLYDENNLLVSLTDPLGNVTRYTYNNAGQVLTMTSPNGGITTYEYETGLPVRVTDPEGNQRTLGYDAAGRLTSITDAEGHITTLVYDGVNRLISIKDALNRTVSMTYDSRDKLLTFTDAKGSLLRRSYDGNGKLISQVNALGKETRYEYDGEGHLLKVIDAQGHISQLGYDVKGRLVSITDALGNTRQLAYDQADNLLKRIDALGNTIALFDYDERNNLLSVTNVLNQTTKFEYNALNRVTRTVDSLNRVTQLNYDELGRFIASIDPKGGQSTQAFDTEDNLTGITDPNSNQTGFKFDKNGRLVEEQSATGNKASYTYNARDLLTTFTNARGQSRQFEHDAAGRLTKMTDPDGTVTYTYDNNDNVLTVTAAKSTISREYDALDRVVKYTDSQGNTLQYAYDEVGHLVTLTYPNGQLVHYEYDSTDQLTQVTDWAGRETHYEYDANGRLVKTTRPNGTVMTRTYNVAGQLVQQQDVDPQGQVLAQYDFSYDVVGNIVKEVTTPTLTPFPFKPVKMTYTAENRLATYNDQAVIFDADGNMTQGPVLGGMSHLTFDSRNRLATVGETSYRYDAENQRIAVKVGSQETRYVINSQPVLSQVLVKTAPDGSQTFYVYGLGLLGEETNGTYLAYHFDLRGSTMALSDASGKVVERFQYSPYGELVSHSPASVKTPFLYNGRDGVMTDATGLYYMRARFYSPEVRRFVNRDVLLGKVAEGQTLNRFAFVTGRPVSFIDPFGLAGIGAGAQGRVCFIFCIGQEYLISPSGTKYSSTFYGAGVATGADLGWGVSYTDSEPEEGCSSVKANFEISGKLLVAGGGVGIELTGGKNGLDIGVQGSVEVGTPVGPIGIGGGIGTDGAKCTVGTGMGFFGPNAGVVCVKKIADESDNNAVSIPLPYSVPLQELIEKDVQGTHMHMLIV